MLTSFQLGVICAANPKLYNKIYNEETGECGPLMSPFPIHLVKQRKASNCSFQDGLFWEFNLDNLDNQKP